MLDAHRKALRRGEYNQEIVEDLPLADTVEDPVTQLDQKQRVDRVLAAVAQLGERCREPFKWKLEGKNFPEIQTLMGQTSINTVYTWDLRCRKQLDTIGDSFSAETKNGRPPDGEQPFPLHRVRCILRADRDSIFDQIKGFFWNHVFRHQFTLHAIGAIAHDAIGLVLLQAEKENHVVC